MAATVASPATLAEAEADFLEARRLGIDAHPTLLRNTAHGTDRLGGLVTSADALDQHVATTTAAWSHPSALCERKRTHVRPDPERPRRR
ncbi:hypothetical protein OG223_53670 [Streptomyces sp. NBC_01478]|uniref:hypothetical protein n=1 Tax=Streptomyces sp. NBC_01478 TaxID=2903882 RepID=UPI002E30B7B2|nr:hypothetical protein [Streptomyces sp. NBC_01478]